MFDWFWKFVYLLLTGITGLIDFLLDIFRVLSGLTPVTIDGKEGDILSHFMTSTSISSAFWLIVFIGIGLLFLATIFMIVRIQYDNPDGSKTPAKVVGKACKSFLLFFMVPIIMIVGVTLVTVVVQQVDMATNPYYEEMVENPDFDGYARTTIGGQILVTIGEEAWKDGISDADKIKIRSNFLQQKDGYNYLKTADVMSYFEISDLNYSLGFITGVAFLVILASSMLTFAERIVNILMLYVISPFPIAVSVIDDGQRFKMWRDQVLVKFLSAFGVLIALNVYNLMAPVIQNMSFGVAFYGDSSASTLAFTDGLIKLFLLLGAAIAVKKAPVLIGNLISQGAGSQEEADRAHGMQSMGRMLGMAAGAAKVAATPLTFGAKKAGGALFSAMDRPRKQASERREKIRQMKSDAKLHDKIAGTLGKSDDDRSKGEKQLAEAYTKSKALNSAEGIKPAAPAEGKGKGAAGGDNPARASVSQAMANVRQRQEAQTSGPDDGAES